MEKKLGVIKCLSYQQIDHDEAISILKNVAFYGSELYAEKRNVEAKDFTSSLS